MFKRWRSFCLVVVLSVVSGFVFNYYRGSPTLGFISPIVLVKELGWKNKPPLSPFGLLFNRDQKTKLVSPAGSLSLANSTNKQAGSVLGQSTTGGNEFVSTNPAVTASAASTSSNSSTSNTTASTTQTVASTTSTSSNTATATTFLTDTQKDVQDKTNVVLEYLKGGYYTELYKLMSADFRNTFSLEDFVASFSSSVVSSGSIVADPRIFGTNNEWAEQSVRITLADGSIQNYLNIYHLESTAWTLYATQDQ